MIFSADLEATCRNMDGDIWFPESIRIGSTLKPSASAQVTIDNSITALAVCSTCPIRQTCLQAAIDNVEEYGIWGGTFPYERHTVAPFK